MPFSIKFIFVKAVSSGLKCTIQLLVTPMPMYHAAAGAQGTAAEAGSFDGEEGQQGSAGARKEGASAADRAAGQHIRQHSGTVKKTIDIFICRMQLKALCSRHLGMHCPHTYCPAIA